MSQVRVGKHRAVFPPGYVDRALWSRANIFIGQRSRRVRAFVFGHMPYGRLRTHLAARYFREIVADMGRGAFEKLMPSVGPDAEVQLWNFGTYRGRDGWKTALAEWLDTFGNPMLEMREYIDPGNTNVLLVGILAGSLRDTDLEIERELFFHVRVEEGMAVAARLYDSKAEAFEAVGLSE